MRLTLCIDCGTPSQGQRCPQHQAKRVATKRSAYTHPDYLAMKAQLAAVETRCHWCDNPATTPDHLTPIADGGALDRTNLVPACTTCNYGRGEGR